MNDATGRGRYTGKIGKELILLVIGQFFIAVVMVMVRQGLIGNCACFHFFQIDAGIVVERMTGRNVAAMRGEGELRGNDMHGFMVSHHQGRKRGIMFQKFFAEMDADMVAAGMAAAVGMRCKSAVAFDFIIDINVWRFESKRFVACVVMMS